MRYFKDKETIKSYCCFECFSNELVFFLEFFYLIGFAKLVLNIIFEPCFLAFLKKALRSVTPSKTFY